MLFIKLAQGVASFITDGDYQKIMFADLDTMDDENDII